MKGGYFLKDLYVVREKIVSYLIKRGWKEKLAKAKNKYEEQQSLLEHTIKCLDIILVLIPILQNEKLMGLTESQIKSLILAISSHDAGKEQEDWAKYLFGNNKYVDETNIEIIENVLKDLIELLDFTDVDIELVKSITKLHMKKHRTTAELFESFKVENNEPKWKILQEVIDIVDNLASINTIFEAKKYFENSILGKYFHVNYHLVFVRGVSTVSLNKAVEDAFHEDDWQPILYFSNGTIYVKAALNDVEQIKIDSIKYKLIKEIQQLLDKKKEIIPELVVGNITANFLPKPELFSTKILKECFLVSFSRAGRKKGKDISESNAYKYHNLRNILDEINDPILATKCYTSFNKLKKQIPKKYHQFLIFSKEELDGHIVKEYRSKLGEAYPEIAAFKFFKNIMTPNKGLITEDEENIVKTEYEKVFGKNSYSALKSTSNLMPAKDLAFSVDYFWNLEGNKFNKKVDRIGFLSEKERGRLLIDVLVSIAERIYTQIESPPSQEKVATNMAEEFLQDLIFPSKKQKSIKEHAQKQLEYYKKGKHNLYSDTDSEHICPICNSQFNTGNQGFADFLNKPNSFTNRALAYKSVSNPLICKICYFENILKQILLGGKCFEKIILLPNLSLGYYGGQELVKKANNLMNEARKYMTNSSENPDQRITFNLLDLVAQKAIKSDFNRISSEELAKLLTYKRSSERCNDDIKKISIELKKQYKDDLEDANYIYEVKFKNWIEFSKAVYYKEINDDLLSSIREEVINLKEVFQIICRTPNLIIMPCWNPVKQDSSPLRINKESDTDLGFKKIFLSLMLSLGLDCTVAVIKDEEILDDTIIKNKGQVYIPPIEGVRRLISQRWIPQSDAIKWFKALASALILSRKTNFSVKNQLYEILTINSAGKLLRRIEQQNEYVGYEEIELIENVKEVFKMGLKSTFIEAKGKGFKFANIRNDIDLISDKFSVYLDGFQSKQKSDSKHTVMGPVGKILEKAKTSEWSKSDLLGYALRVHEMTNESGSYLKKESLEAMEEAVEKILELLIKTPLNCKTKVIEHIGHAVYYKRRKQNIEYFESVRKEFLCFLKNKYGTNEKLSKIWGVDSKIEDILYPSKNQLKKSSGKKAEDIKYFRENILKLD